MRGLIALMVGLLFALGLGLSGMTQPHIVQGFLDVFGEWDWRLMGVMFGAIGIHAVSFRLIVKRDSPLLDTSFKIPMQNHIDARLISGAALFGLGWGWAGICPGPGIVSLASGDPVFMYFIGAMLIGMFLFQLLESKMRSE